MFRLGLSEGIFECCSPASLGEPEFLAQEQHISSRARSNLVTSASGNLQLYFQKWQSDRHDRVRSVVFVHHGETEHSGWYNALAVRLAAVGCTTFALDAQGWGQSDGARGYFEGLEELVNDFVEFCKTKWAEVLNTQTKVHSMRRPGLVLMGKGFGALVAMRALLELQELADTWGVTPVLVLVSPAFQFADFISEQSNGYRSRVLDEIVHEQLSLADSIMENAEVFVRTPALILHGSGDKLFAVQGSHGLHSVWCDAAQKRGIVPRLKVYYGAFHQLLNEPNKDEVMNDIVVFIASKAIPA